MNHDDTTVQDRRRVDRGHAALWIVAGASGLWWSGRRVAHTYFHYDEWSMLARGIKFDPIHGATRSYNGHLYLFQDLVYRTQATFFGLDHNRFVAAVFLASLLALHFALAWLAIRLGMSPLLALATGGLITYLGAASETFIFPFQLSPTFAAAVAITATAVAIDHDPSRRRAVVVGSLLVLSVLFDSGMSVLGLALGGGIVVSTWPRRFWWTLVPSVVIVVSWALVADLGQSYPGTLADRAGFMLRLILRSAGALVGGGAWAGAAVLVAGGAAVTVAVHARLLSATARAVSFSGLAATLLTAASIAQSRATIAGFTFFNFNRYLQNVGLPLAVTFIPALVSVAGAATRRWPQRQTALHAIGVIMVALAFAAALDDERSYATAFVGWNETVERDVKQTVSLITFGCPPGTRLDPNSIPAGDISPQLSTSLLIDLVERDLLTSGQRSEYDPAVTNAVCAP